MGTLSVNNWCGYSHSETGKIRELNEDSVFDCDKEQLWAVADGMGGHENGDYASQWVVTQLKHYRKAKQTGISLSNLIHLLEQSNTHLIKKAAHDHSGIIGCTVAVLSIHGEQAICSWSGDSRIYRYRDAQLLQLTRDHSYRSQSEDRDVIRFPDSPVAASEFLTSAIGGEVDMHLEHCVYSLQQDDRFLLCTDGLYKEITDDEISSLLAQSTKPDEITRKLSEIYNAREARDNMGFVYVSNLAN